MNRSRGLAVVWAGVFVCGCGTPPGPAAREPAPAAAGLEPEPEPEPEPAAPGLLRSCEGEHLDLAWIHATGSCRVEGDADRSDGPALTPRLEPAEARLAPGASTEITLVLENRSGVAASFDLNIYCFINGLEWKLLAESGARADVIEQCGRRGGGCGGPLARVRLPPGGDLRLPLPMSATVRREDAACRRSPPEPLAPGRYTVKVELPQFDNPPSAHLVVEAR
jgi:hypothetical protein